MGGLREGPPDITLVTEKAPSVYAACVASGWGNFMGVSVNQTQTPDGTHSVSMPSLHTGNNGVMDAEPSHTGSRVEVRYRLSGLGGYGKFTKVVHDCGD